MKHKYTEMSNVFFNALSARMECNRAIFFGRFYSTFIQIKIIECTLLQQQKKSECENGQIFLFFIGKYLISPV